ncbi:DnaA regulatory inactivator Hda [Parasulfuritortus cantonensis]|uniref:DnaA regulatory inactivator Hda n=1 Tax=Parasulfuritortus cantonensis TaxID=2528202 RepID=A0A4R1B7U2_9PROT|nr:DnaA regulatory inactivator Hda [Parasulfuritortus cantonensis]
MRQLVLNIRPEAPPRFDNFMPGDNLELLLALDTLARGELPESVVYVWGAAGSGRSHLLQATVAEAGRHGRAARYGGPELPDELDGLLAVDDVDGLDEAAQVRLFSLINQAREGAGTVLAAGPAAPAQLSLRADLATRLGWGLVFGLRPLNEADRATAIHERARALGLALAEEVVRYLLSHGRRDLPSLLAGVDALDAYSLSLKRPVTVPLVREWLAGRS